MIHKRYMQHSVLGVLKQCSNNLSKISPTPLLESEIIVAHCINQSKEFLSTNPEYKLNPLEYKNIKQALKQRKKRMPLAYILKQKEFYNHVFSVNSSVLIPRPETEGLIEILAKIIPRNIEKILDVLEIGSGSGCLSISLVEHFKQIKITAIDVDKTALKLAKYNAQKILSKPALNRICFKFMDILKSFPSEKYYIIISNPPYIPTAQINKLQPEIYLYEPKLALDGGRDGLKFYKRFNSIFPRILSNKGFALLEIHSEHVKALKKIYSNKFNLKFFKNYAQQYQYVMLSTKRGYN